MTLVSFDDDPDWEFALIRALGIRPALAGANGQEIEETVRAIAHLAPACRRRRYQQTLEYALLLVRFGLWRGTLLKVIVLAI